MRIESEKERSARNPLIDGLTKFTLDDLRRLEKIFSLGVFPLLGLPENFWSKARHSALLWARYVLQP